MPSKPYELGPQWSHVPMSTMVRGVRNFVEQAFGAGEYEALFDEQREWERIDAEIVIAGFRVEADAFLMEALFAGPTLRRTLVKALDRGIKRSIVARVHYLALDSGESTVGLLAREASEPAARTVACCRLLLDVPRRVFDAWRDRDLEREDD